MARQRGKGDRPGGAGVGRTRAAHISWCDWTVGAARRAPSSRSRTLYGGSYRWRLRLNHYSCLRATRCSAADSAFLLPLRWRHVALLYHLSSWEGLGRGHHRAPPTGRAGGEDISVTNLFITYIRLLLLPSPHLPPLPCITTPQHMGAILKLRFLELLSPNDANRTTFQLYCLTSRTNATTCLASYQPSAVASAHTVSSMPLGPSLRSSLHQPVPP